MDEDRELTDIGRELARLPLDPRVGRMLVAARDGALPRAGADHRRGALGAGPARAGRSTSAAAADERHAQFADERSDFLALPQAVEAVRRQVGEGLPREFPLGAAHARMARRRRRSSAGRSRSWNGSASSVEPEATAPIHRALLHRAARQRRHARRGRGKLPRRARHQVLDPPGSGVKKPGRWIDGGRAGRNDAPVRALRSPPSIRKWLEELGGHLLKRDRSDPHLGEAPRAGGGARARRRSTACRSTPTGASAMTTRPRHAKSSSARRW